MSISVMDIIKQKHHPEQYAAEQEAADKLHQERLAFIDGFKELYEHYQITKAKPLYVSDSTSPSGFKPNK